MKDFLINSYQFDKNRSIDKTLIQLGNLILSSLEVDYKKSPKSLKVFTTFIDSVHRGETALGKHLRDHDQKSALSS